MVLWTLLFQRNYWVLDLCVQTPRKLFMLYRTENQFFTTFSNFKHGYIKKFYWSSHIFHWSSLFFIGRGPRTDKFRWVCVSLHTVEGRWTIMRQRVLKQGCKLAWLLVIKYVLWLLMPWHHASSRTSAVTIIRLPTNPDPGKSAPLHYSYLTWASWHLRSLATWLFVEQLVTNNNKRNTKTLQYRPFVRGIDKSPMDSPHKRPESQPVFFMWWHHPG